jgi:hypothetical protein
MNIIFSLVVRRVASDRSKIDPDGVDPLKSPFNACAPDNLENLRPAPFI